MAIIFDTPLHPGEMLREDFLAPFELSAGQLAKAIGVPRTRIERIVKEEMGITADTALRLARYFGNSSGFWMNLQQAYELSLSNRAIASEVARIEPLHAINDNGAATSSSRHGRA